MNDIFSGRRDAIRAAYIAPIRSVVLVDDRFHTFAELVRKSAPPDPVTQIPAAGASKPFEDDKAAALWAACRERGWVCDVENGPDFSVRREFLQRADLIVLDFHLVGQDASNSLAILRHLADSPGSNLVILYTIDNSLDHVRRTVTAYLRGSRRTRDMLSEEEYDVWQELDGYPSFSDDHIDKFLRGDTSYKSDKQLREHFAQLNVPVKMIANILEATLEGFIRLKYGSEEVERTRPVEMSSGNAVQGWAKLHNVFVAFVSKAQETGMRVFDALESAIDDWGPSPAHVTVAYARDSISKGGIRLDDEVLSDASLRTGLLFHALEEHPERGFRNWCERLIQGVSQSMVDDVTRFGSTLISAWPSASTLKGNLQRAHELATRGGRNVSEQDVLCALNGYLCSEVYRGRHIRTGTIFRRADGLESETWWICATPACDMVPREPSGTRWDAGLHPLRPMTVLRAERVSVSGALEKAQYGHHIFFVDREKREAAEVIEHLSRQPSSEVMLVAEQALTDDTNCFLVYRIRRSDGQPHFEQPVKMCAVAQLRPQYSSRLLQETGKHASRIGVDFVPLVKAEPPKKAGK